MARSNCLSCRSCSYTLPHGRLMPSVAEVQSCCLSHQRQKILYYALCSSCEHWFRSSSCIILSKSIYTFIYKGHYKYFSVFFNVFGMFLNHGIIHHNPFLNIMYTRNTLWLIRRNRKVNQFMAQKCRMRVLERDFSKFWRLIKNVDYYIFYLSCLKQQDSIEST